MRAYNKWIICEQVDEPVVLKSGMELGNKDMEEMRYQRAIIIAPPGNLVEKLKEGDTVYYDKVRAFEMTLDGKRVTVINENDIVAVL